MAQKVRSLVSNIVQKASAYDQNVVEESIERLTKKSRNLKGELYEVVKQNYVEFDDYVNTTVELEHRVQEVRTEYQRIASLIEQKLSPKVAQSLDKKEEVESKLRDTQSRIVLIQHLVDVHHAIETSKVDLQSEKYLEAAELLSKASELLSGLAKGGCDALVFRALKSELAMMLADLSSQLEVEWNSFLSWSPKHIPNDPNLEVLAQVELRVPLLASKEKEISEIVNAMKHLTSLGVWEKRVKLFSSKVLKLIVKPLVVHGSLRINQSSNKSQVVLTMTTVDTESSSIGELYNMLLCVFQVVSQVVAEDHKEEWLALMGRTIYPEVEELVIAHRLSSSIPKNLSELEDYKTTHAKTTEEFEDSVRGLGFVDVGRTGKLSAYTDSINDHFVMQKSQDMLTRARSLLMQPIHDTVSTDNVDSLGTLNQVFPVVNSTQSKDTAAENKDVTNSSGISSTNISFAFPCCVISKSVQEYLQYFYHVLGQSIDSTSASSASQFFQVARSMVDLFCAVLPSYHGSAISESPRAAALQHNNCMYLAHNLITLGHQFYSRLPPPLNQQSSTFVDYVPVVRQLGEDCFSAELRKQAACVLSFLKSFGTFHKVSGDDQRELVWQSMQMAVLHISNVSKSYREILPGHMHLKAVGKLLDAFVAKIIRMVLSMEDITASDATELHTVLNFTVNKSSQVLMAWSKEDDAIDDSMSKFSKNWAKLRILALVLNASLLEIVDMWDSGEGQLAGEFSMGEVRSLIKAIFRNTERRAAALNRIVAS